MTESTETAGTGEWDFIGRRGSDPTRLVPGRLIAEVPAAKAMAEHIGRELRFDFLDDRAVLHMLRLRHRDEEAMFNAGLKIGAPLAIVLFGAGICWGGVAQYWQSSSARTGFLACAAAVILFLLVLYVRAARKHWGDPVRQNLRARAHAYRELAHLARKEGADIPPHYPHYGPSPFAATFHPEADDVEWEDDHAKGNNA
ncbi:hypothetical protein [Streptomyces sp. NPDC003299]